MKRLVICADGTWNTPDQRDGGVLQPTNVVKVARAVAPIGVDGVVQVVFYDRGVGTGNLWDRLTGGAFGKGLEQNIRDAYLFLMHNYAPGDAVFLFGFSRGAYTVRSLAGMLRNCGLLRTLHAGRLPEAYAMYRGPVKPDDPAAIAFREAYAYTVGSAFLGVWDTVGALGIPITGLQWITRRKHQFHDVRLSRSVKSAFQALAVDEQRRPFRPAIWETAGAATQRVEQVWFAGVHSNVGGGYRDTGLSDLALQWMVARATECGLTFEPDYLAAVAQPNAGGVLRDSRTGIYRWLGRHVRAVGGTPTESMSPSVRERMTIEALGYRPGNVLAYWQGIGERPPDP